MVDVPPRRTWRVAQPTQYPLPASTEGLLEADINAIPVRITIVQDNVTTGWDDGAMGFEEDAVWFSGRACSFRIAAGDILPGTYAYSGIEAVTDEEARKLGFPLAHPRRKLLVRVEVLVTQNRREWEDESLLVREVKRLRALPGGDGSSQYLPLEPRPGMVRPHRETYRGRLLAAGVGLILLTVSGNDESSWPSMLLRIAGAMCLLTAVGLTEHPDQSTLRKIAEEERA